MADTKPRPVGMAMFGDKKKKFANKIYTVSTKTVAKTPPVDQRVSAKPTAPVRLNKSGLPKLDNNIRRSVTPSQTPSRKASPISSAEKKRKEPPVRSKRASPVVTTPIWGSDEEDESEVRRKRAKIDENVPPKVERRVKDDGAFQSENTGFTYEIIHAADIARNDIVHHGKYQFAEYFTALQEDEEECPTISLQYPCRTMTERYQLVRPADRTDFKPLSEIQDNMRIMAEFYLDEDTAETIMPEGFGDSGGLVGRLQKAAKDAGRPGAQQRFIDVVNEFNRIVESKRADGTIERKLDQMNRISLKLVQHIVKDQIYARTVSPSIQTVKDYVAFSDNVYGELMPKFLSNIFKEVNLSSDQIFVDLGSGVGNCVLQAALEVGCESWGCEVMKHPAQMAEAQAKEFRSRCRMWGIKPGRVHMIQDDFTANDEIQAVLKRADVVLVNNQAFTPQLNERLKHMFLDLKQGCQIVSLKYFRDPAHRVKETNINDIVNGLRVVEKERFSGMVSWTDDPGKWYITVKDDTELRRARKKMERRA